MNIKEFPISIYGQVEKYNDVLSKARARIFYQKENRNGTYITPEFAEKLLNSLPYTPVKGIFEEGDYTDHGDKRSEGRIYGIVPETPNIAYEKHVDEDGVEREYACADVLIFTALYEEANEIVGKALSMELYEPAIKMHYAIYGGQKYVVFDEGCFLGLQVLGDEVEPCFEGASFYTLQKTIEDTIEKIKEYSKKGGNSQMVINFKLSDDQKFSALWILLNTNYTEEGNWEVTYSINSVYDDYALVFNYETGMYQRAYYKKNDEDDSVEITELVDVYVVDVTTKEKETLDTLRTLNGGTYELVNEKLENAEATAEKCSECELKIDELNETISTLNTEVSEAKAQFEQLTTEYTAATTQINNLTEENETLRNYKHSIETQQKEAVITEYADKLSEEVLDAYKEKLDDFTVIDLDKELAYELKKSNSSIFNQDTPGFVPKDQELDGIAAILSRYNKK